jgi:hypothetical protein
VAIAEVPGDANQMLRVIATNFKQQLRRRDDLDQPVVLEHQRVAAAQRHRVLEVQQQLKPAGARHRHSPPMTIVEVEHNGVGRGLAPAVRFQNFRGADCHSQYMK